MEEFQARIRRERIKEVTVKNSKRPTASQASSSGEDDLYAVLNMQLLISSVSSKAELLVGAVLWFASIRSPLEPQVSVPLQLLASYWSLQKLAATSPNTPNVASPEK